ncbi:MAG: hypothetical protein IKK28_05385, partial [Mogibacterium sp.]|nr:hypothetical protein [Mogibacterium sp.]
VTNELYLKELRSALKIDDYISNVADSQKGRSTVIRQVKIQESARHKAAALAMLKEAIGESSVFISGNEITDIKTKEAQTKIGQALEKLVDVKFPLLSYIDKAMEDSDIKALFEGSKAVKLDLEEVKEPNALAVNEVKEYIKNSTLGHMPISIKTIMDQFTKSPYGYIDEDVKWLVAKVFKDGLVTATVDKEPITLYNRKPEELTTYFTGKKYQEKILFLPKDEIDPQHLKASKDVSKALFKVTVTTNEPDKLQQDLKVQCERLINKCDLYLERAADRKEYPGKTELKNAKDKLNVFLNISDQKAFFKKLHEMKDELMDLADDLDPVLTFYSSDSQRKIFNDYGLRALRFYDSSKEHIDNKEIETTVDKIRNIIRNPRPYGLIKNLPALYEEFSLQYLKVLKEKAGPVKKKIEQNRDVLISYIDNNPFAEKYRDEIIQKFKEFIDKVESANDISIMLGYKDKADSLMNQYFNKFDNETPYEPPTPGEGTSSVGESNGDKPVMPKKKTTVNYNAGMLQTSWRIESEEELDTYIKSFRDQITGLIEEDKIVKINF